MKNIILIIISFASISVDCMAQMTDKKEAIKQLFIVMRQDSLMEKTMRDMAMAMSGNYANGSVSDTSFNNQKKKIMDKQMAATKVIMSKMVKEDMVDVYDKHFTLQEITDFTNFYKTKSGQQLLIKLPDVTKELMMTMTSKYLPDLRKSMEEAVKEN